MTCACTSGKGTAEVMERETALWQDMTMLSGWSYSNLLSRNRGILKRSQNSQAKE